VKKGWRGKVATLISIESTVDLLIRLCRAMGVSAGTMISRVEKSEK